MGNYSVLYLGQHSQLEEILNDEHSLDFYIKYSIPMFWLALFQAEDIQYYQDTQEDNYSYYYFIASKEKCIASFQARLTIWSILYHENVEILAQAFFEFLNHNQYCTIVLRIDDVIGMSFEPNSAQAQLEMQDMLKSFDQFNQNHNVDLFKHSLWLVHIHEWNLTVRYYLDGLGHEQLPCPLVDNWLKQQHDLTSSKILKHKPFKIWIFILNLVIIGICSILIIMIKN